MAWRFNFGGLRLGLCAIILTAALLLYLLLFAISNTVIPGIDRQLESDGVVTATAATALPPPSIPPLTPAMIALRLLYDSLATRRSALRLVLTQTEDLLDESSFLHSSFLKPEVVVTRVGVLEEDFDELRSALDAFMERRLLGVSRKDVRVADPRRWTPDKRMEKDGNITSHVFIIIALNDSRLPEIKPKFAKPNQFYHWKRIHFRVIFQRGVKSVDQPLGYRWIAPEPDDIAHPRFPSESYEAFEVQSATTTMTMTTTSINDELQRKSNIFFVPMDKKMFISEKDSAEFKECPVHSLKLKKKFENNWRGKVVTDPKAIRKYMTSIMAVKRLVRPYGIRSWLNCGSLLGWYRQCSLIPKDPDIDMLHYSSPEYYPRIHADILKRKDIFKILKIGINEDSPGGYQRGFYWKLAVKSGINIDTYFYFSHRVYNMNHKKGDIKYFDFTDKICSADLHGYRVYVLCTDDKNRDLSRVYYGPNIFSPKR